MYFDEFCFIWNKQSQNCINVVADVEGLRCFHDFIFLDFPVHMFSLLMSLLVRFSTETFPTSTWSTGVPLHAVVGTADS